MLYRGIGARIAATGSYMPEKVVTNTHLAGAWELAKKLQRLLGAEERREVKDGEACSDLIVEAAKKVLTTARVSPLDVDRIIVSATPGDFLEPPTSSVVQYKLQARCPAVDVKMSCVGWLAGVDYALRCIATGEKRILVLAGTVVSRGDAFHTLMHRAIFGDGAGGVLIEADEQQSFLAGGLWTDGQYYTMINQPHPGSVHPQEIPLGFKGKFYMGPRKVFFNTLRRELAPCVESVLKEARLSTDDIDVAIIHQPSRKLFEAAVRSLKIAPEKSIQNFHRYGNTISAELPIALDENIRNGRIKRGDKLLLVTFGAGFNAGAMVLEY
ncbi:MAG: 3-oxoacyl-ACP synthase III family protein [Candidatus Entotheonellia bacterium]